MNRRRFLGLAALGVVGTATVIKLADNDYDRALHFGGFDAALAEVKRLAATQQRVNHGEWGLAKVLIHCAQSIEMSVYGFPQHKPELFKVSVGSAAFSYFAWRGQMSHDLAEAIPGAEQINPNTALSAAMQRLEQSILQFEQASSFMPHFAFGELNKADYRQAHLLHIADHLSAFEMASV